MAARRTERVTTTKTTTTTRGTARPNPVETTVQRQGLQMGDALAITSFVLMIGALVVLDMLHGRLIGNAIFFNQG